MDDFPDELVLAILEATGSPRVVACVALVSTRYNSLAMDETLWRTLYMRRFGPPMAPPTFNPTADAEYRFHSNKGWRWNFMARTPAPLSSRTPTTFSSRMKPSMDLATYSGDIVDQKPHGHGTLVRPRPAHSIHTAKSICWSLLSSDPSAALQYMSVYTGGWANGKRHGHGEGIWCNGTRYEGDWVNDLCDGRGTMVYANGDRYEGGWRQGQKHGEGIYTYRIWGRLSLEGHFVAGLCVGDAVVRTCFSTWRGIVGDRGFSGRVAVSSDDGGTRAIATFAEGILDGPYLITNPDGSSFSCQHDGVKRKSGGHGTLILADGRRRDGNWDEEKAIGSGIITYPDGSQWAGEWIRGDGTKEVPGRTITHGSSGDGTHSCVCLACTDDSTYFDVDLDVFYDAGLSDLFEAVQGC
jgi:hypothetical protein